MNIFLQLFYWKFKHVELKFQINIHVSRDFMKKIVDNDLTRFKNLQTIWLVR